MPAYRLEIWFNYTNQTVNWGVAQATGGGTPPFSNGGTAIAQSNNKVTITGAGNNSTMDVYVFDASGDGTTRQLQWIEVDFEKANQGSGGGNDPVQSAPGLRDGMSGADFMGAANGGANGTTTGVGQENTIFSAPSGTTAQRRWSMTSGFTQLTPGDYTFTVAIVPSLVGGAVTLQIDPEMDIQS